MASPGPLQQPAFTWMHDLLWPDTVGSGATEQYAVLSRKDRPRLIVPLGSPRAAAAALRRVTADESPRRLFLRRVLAAMASRGMLQPFLRHRFIARPDEDGAIESHLAKSLAVDRVSLAITIGPPRPNRKPVIQIMTPEGSTLAFAKVGWNGLTRALVAQEAAALRGFDRSRLDRLVLPEVIALDRWRDVDVLILSSVEPSVGENVQHREPSSAEIEELRTLRPEQRSVLRDAGYFHQLRERATAIGGEVGREISGTVALVAQQLGDTPVLFAGGHGDWTPWNMVATDRHLRVWDWERAIDPLPFPLDVINYHTHRAWLSERVPFTEAVMGGAKAARRALGDAGLPPDQAMPLAALYVSDQSLRLAENTVAGTDEALRYHHEEIRQTLRSMQ